MARRLSKNREATEENMDDIVEFLCHCLTPNELADESWQLVKGVENRNWEQLIQFADASYLSPALYLGLRRHGLFSMLNQEEVQGYFEAIHFLSVDRNQRLKAQSVDLIKMLNSAGIEPVLLKGIAGILDGLYEDDGERIMSDIDVLIDTSELTKAVDVMRRNGYYYHKEPTKFQLDMKYKHHAPPMVSKGCLASVELHIRPTILAGKRTLVDAAYARQGARMIEVDGAIALIPSAEFRLLHNFFHSQHQDGRNYRFARLHIRGLLDWVELRQAFDTEVNWEAMIERVKRYDLYRSFSAYLLNAESYFGQPVPEMVVLSFGAKMHVRRQYFLLKHPRFTRLHELSIYFLRGCWDFFFSPASARSYYGDASVSVVIRQRLAKLMSSSWRKDKYNDIRRIIGW